MYVVYDSRVTEGSLPRDPLVSASNWLEAPFNRWSMWHVRELVPTQLVSRGTGPVTVLPERTDPLDLDSVPVTRVDGTMSTVRAVLDCTFTDAFAVLQNGMVAAEWYAPGEAPSTFTLCSR